MHFVSVKEKEHFYELYKQMGITLDVKTKWVIFDDIYFEVACMLSGIGDLHKLLCVIPVRGAEANPSFLDKADPKLAP